MVLFLEGCPLCSIDKDKENIWYEDQKIIILDTKNKKGHKGRIMVVWKSHEKEIPKGDEDYAINKLKESASEVFSYTNYYEIFQDKYSSVMNHWHRIASDIDSNSDDFLQILDTPRSIYSKNGDYIKSYDL